MRRRDFVKAMVAASASAGTMWGQQAVTPATPPAPPAPGPVPWMRGLTEVKPLPITPLVPDAVAQPQTEFFSATQFATLRRLSEILMPPYKGYPGAIDAGAPEFLDFLIGSSPADRRQMYVSGLDRLEAESRRHFGKSFASVDKAQADQLLRPWLRTWMNDHPPTDPYAHFVNVAHTDIRTATINSQAWNQAAIAAGEKSAGMGLYWFPVEPNLRREASGAVQRPGVRKQPA